MSVNLKINKRELLLIILGCTFMAIGVNSFLKANNIITGGVSGIGIILNSISIRIFEKPFPLWITNILINIPLLIYAIRIYGYRFLCKTIFATLFFSVALIYTDFLPEFKGDLMLVAIFGGIIEGIGLGLVFKANSSTGGSDLLATILKHYFKHIGLPLLLLVIDFIVVLIGTFEFGVVATMYSIIFIYIASKFNDTILQGWNFVKGLYIITDCRDEISKCILEDVNRGGTIIDAKGMYTNTHKNIIFCVVNDKEVHRIKELVTEIDKNAFIILSDVREVYGEGFER